MKDMAAKLCFTVLLSMTSAIERTSSEETCSTGQPFVITSEDIRNGKFDEIDNYIAEQLTKGGVVSVSTIIEWLPPTDGPHPTTQLIEETSLENVKTTPMIVHTTPTIVDSTTTIVDATPTIIDATPMIGDTTESPMTATEPSSSENTSLISGIESCPNNSGIEKRLSIRYIWTKVTGGNWLVTAYSPNTTITYDEAEVFCKGIGSEVLDNATFGSIANDELQKVKAAINDPAHSTTNFKAWTNFALDNDVSSAGNNCVMTANAVVCISSSGPVESVCSIENATYSCNANISLGSCYNTSSIKPVHGGYSCNEWISQRKDICDVNFEQTCSFDPVSNSNLEGRQASGVKGSNINMCQFIANGSSFKIKRTFSRHQVNSQMRTSYNLSLTEQQGFD